MKQIMTSLGTNFSNEGTNLSSQGTNFSSHGTKNHFYARELNLGCQEQNAHTYETIFFAK
jgi:hypothetical protein